MSTTEIVIALFAVAWSLPLLVFVALVIATVRDFRREDREHDAMCSEIASWRVGP